MISTEQRSREAAMQEREVGFLSARSGVPLVDVRALFIPELKRLAMGAKVGSYLTVLAASNVRGMLRRKARLAAAASTMGCHAKT